MKVNAVEFVKLHTIIFIQSVVNTISMNTNERILQDNIQSNLIWENLIWGMILGE